MRDVYITGIGAYLPGDPVGNDEIETRLGLVDGKPSRSRDMVLKNNGIQTRHYALDEQQRTTELNEELAAKAVLRALEDGGIAVEDVQMLAVGTTMGDTPVPGFASMVHGRLGGGPKELLTAGGVCASSMGAFQAAARAIATGEHDVAVVCGSELVSRGLKASRFAKESVPDENGFSHFDADFLRWMLSDGAGAVVLQPQPRSTGLSLRVDWRHVASYAHEHDTCMYVGLREKQEPQAGRTWLDYPRIAGADRAGLMKLRQDTRMLPDLVRLGTEAYLRHVRSGRIHPSEIDHLLCHYSSEFFRGEIVRAMADTGLAVPDERWFSNLTTKGNTGAASIWIMLEEAFHAGRIHAGERTLLMVPESGRFTVAFALLTCVGPEGTNGAERAVSEPAAREYHWASSRVAERSAAPRDDASLAAALAASPLGAPEDDDDAIARYLVLELALVWADFERMLKATPFFRRVEARVVTLDDYKRLLCNLRQQVMEGARWIARAASSISIELFPLRSLMIGHADEEHRDYQMLERDYVAVGGTLEEIQSQPKNVGSEAFSAFMFHRAGQPDPIDLLGAMFVIEGLGTAKAAGWAEQLQDILGLTDDQVTFLRYHGVNDDDHFEKLREVIRSGVIDRPIAEQIVKTAKVVARLYALQIEELDHV